jgi:LysM repeat protein
MVLRHKYIVLLVLALVLSGCFRQASQPEDTLDSTISNTASPNNTGDNVIVPASNTPVNNSDPTQIQMFTSTPVVPQATIQQPTNTPPPPTIVPVTTADSSSSGPAPMFSPSPSPEVYLTPVVPGSNAVTSPTPLAPTATLAPLITPTDFADTEITDGCIYVVQAGDTLFRIALNNDLSQAEMQAANPALDPDLIRPGDELVIPGCNEETTEDAIEVEVEATAEESDPATVDQTIHTVQAGETLGSIARYYGVTSLSIIQANSLANPDVLAIDQELIIPPVEP